MANLCFYLSKRALSKASGSAEADATRFERSAYQDWRDSELRSHLAECVEPAELEGKDVLDLGCGSGELAFYLSRMGVKSITGIDLDQELLELANSRAANHAGSPAPKFVLGIDPKKIEVPANSMDVIVCFDVLEHILDYGEVIADWRRVLRPNGEVLIWWMPWYHPYGHHIKSLVPLPWAHVLFSDRVLIETCARIYDLPEYRPRLWDRDGDGNKKPNKWRAARSLPTVNRLSAARFERVCRQNGLTIRKRRAVPFKKFHSLAGPAADAITGMPFFREFLCSHLVYRVRNEKEREGALK
jgi:SAM-dependent methyltransferase